METDAEKPLDKVPSSCVSLALRGAEAPCRPEAAAAPDAPGRCRGHDLLGGSSDASSDLSRRRKRCWPPNASSATASARTCCRGVLGIGVLRDVSGSRAEFHLRRGGGQALFASSGDALALARGRRSACRAIGSTHRRFSKRLQELSSKQMREMWLSGL